MSAEWRHLWRLVLLLLLVTLALTVGEVHAGRVTWEDSFGLAVFTLAVKWLLERSVRRQINSEDPPISIRRIK